MEFEASAFVDPEIKSSQEALARPLRFGTQQLGQEVTTLHQANYIRPDSSSGSEDDGSIRRISIRSPLAWLESAVCDVAQSTGEIVVSINGGVFIYSENDTPRLSLVDEQLTFTGAVFSPDGKQILSGSMQGQIRVWDSETGQEEYTIARVPSEPSARFWEMNQNLDSQLLAAETHKAVVAVKFLSDGRRFVTAGMDGKLELRDAANGQVLQTFPGHQAGILAVAVSPNGKLIVTGGLDTQIRVWNCGDGQEVFTLRGHTNTVTALDFSPDGSRIVSAGKGRTVRIWDADTGMELLTLKGSAEEVHCVAFSPDGTQVVSGGLDNRARIWDATPNNPTTLTYRDAFRLVKSLYSIPLPAAEVAAAIRSDPMIGDSTRELALSFVPRFPAVKDADALHARSLSIVSRPHLNEFHYRRALRQVELALRLNPDKAEFMTTKGGAQLRLGGIDEARRTLSEAEGIGDRGPINAAFRAIVEHSRGDRDNALTTFEELRQQMDPLERDGKPAALLLYREVVHLLETLPAERLVDSLFAEGLPATTVTQRLDRASELPPGLRAAAAAEVEARVKWAAELGEEWKTEKALVHYRKGNAYARQGENQNAVEAFQQALDLDLPAALRPLVLLYRRTGQTDQAIEACQAAIDRSPEDWHAYNLLAEIHQAARRLDSAAAYFQLAQSKTANIHEQRRLQSQLGHALEEAGRTEEAIAAFRAAVDPEPQGNAWSNGPLERAVERQEDLFRALMATGRSAEVLAEFDGYVSVLQRLHEIGPQKYRPRLLQALGEWAVLLRAQGETDHARDKLQRVVDVVEAVPDEERSVVDWGLLGKACYRLGRWQEARVALEQIDPSEKWSAYIQRRRLDWKWYLPMALHQLGETADARTVMAALLEQRLDESEREICVEAARLLEIDVAEQLARTSMATAIELRRQLRLEEAIAAYRTVLRYDPQNRLALTRLGMCLRDTGETRRIARRLSANGDKRPVFWIQQPVHGACRAARESGGAITQGVGRRGVHQFRRADRVCTGLQIQRTLCGSSWLLRARL